MGVPKNKCGSDNDRKGCSPKHNRNADVHTPQRIDAPPKFLKKLSAMLSDNIIISAYRNDKKGRDDYACSAEGKKEITISQVTYES